MKTISMIRAMLRILRICPANFKAFFLPCLESFPLNNGTKAALKAPSAKMLLKKFGNLNATLKASASGPMPKKVAIRISLMKPNILEIKVRTENIMLDFKNNLRSSFLSYIIECIVSIDDVIGNVYNKQY